MDGSVGIVVFGIESEHDESVHVGAGQEVGRVGPGDGRLAHETDDVAVVAGDILRFNV